MKQNAQRAIIVVAALVMLAVTAVPTTLAAQPITWVRVVDLDTPPSDPASADGMVQIGSSPTTEFFRLRAFADLPDGTVLLVRVRRSDRPAVDPWVAIGTIEIQLGSGLLSLRDDVGYSTPAFPLAGLEEVRVTAGTAAVILRGSF